MQRNRKDQPLLGEKAPRTPFLLAKSWEEKQIHPRQGRRENHQWEACSSHVDRSHGLVSREPQAHSESAPIHMGLPTWQWQHLKLGARQGGCELCPETWRVFPKCQAAAHHGWVQTRGKPLWSLWDPHQVPVGGPLQTGGRGGKVEGDLLRCTKLESELEKPSSNCGRRAGSREFPPGRQAGSWTGKQRWLKCPRCSDLRVCWREVFETSGHLNLNTTDTKSRHD